MGSAGKKVSVIVRTTPLNTLKSVEAFRLGVGLTLEGNHVDILLMEEGVWNAVPVDSRILERPDINPFFNSLELCGAGAFVEAEALPEAYHSRIRDGIQKKTRQEMVEMINRAQVVIPY